MAVGEEMHVEEGRVEEWGGEDGGERGVGVVKDHSLRELSGWVSSSLSLELQGRM